MGIPEEQLNTWSVLGSVTQSKNTYAAISNVLKSGDAPYANRHFSVSLQGSYGNDTNVRGADGDVDIVLCLDSAFRYDLSRLDLISQAQWRASYPGSADYVLSAFRADVVAWLTQNYRGQIDAEGKAIRIVGNGARRNADVLVCIKFRRYYHSFNSPQDATLAEGVSFTLRDGSEIENYPKLHADNCTAKNRETDGWFKPMVRVLKNMRNSMSEQGLIEDGLAPSYYLEGLFYNVPRELYGQSFERTFVSAYNWIESADQTRLTTANGQFWLLRPNSHTSWEPAKFARFLSSLGEFWSNW